MDHVISLFNKHDVRYILIGGQAIRLAGMPRFSMDWDFYVPPRDEENFSKINTLLGAELDMPLVPLGLSGENFVQTFQTQWGILQFHLSVAGVPKFEEAEAQAILIRSPSGVNIRCLSGMHLLTSKKAANRPQDQQDIQFLEKKKEVGKL